MEKLKIAIIHNGYILNGGEDTVVDSEVNLLKAYGHEVVYINEKNDLTQKSSIKQILSFIKNAAWNEKKAQETLIQIKKFNPDIVHIHNFWYKFSPAVHHILAYSGYPIVQTLHNYRIMCINGAFLRNSKPCELCLKYGKIAGVFLRCYRKSIFQSILLCRMISIGWNRNVWNHDITTYICLTKFAKNKYESAGFLKENIEVKPNFVENKIVASNKKPKTVTIIYVGRLSKEKGVDFLVDSIIGMNVHLKIFGTGPLFNQLSQRKIKNVEIFGHIEHSEIKRQMLLADLLVLPTFCYEGMPMCILEAFSCALPVIASNIGGISEIVEDGKNGYLFPPKDSIELKNKILILSNNEIKRKEMGKYAQKCFKERYTSEINYLRLMEIYQGTMKKKALSYKYEF